MTLVFSPPAVIWIARAAWSGRGLTAEQINDRNTGPWPHCSLLVPALIQTKAHLNVHVFCLHVKCKHIDTFYINSYQEMDCLTVVSNIHKWRYFHTGPWGMLQGPRPAGHSSTDCRPQEPASTKAQMNNTQNSCSKLAFVYVHQIYWYLPCYKLKLRTFQYSFLKDWSW